MSHPKREPSHKQTAENGGFSRRIRNVEEGASECAPLQMSITYLAIFVNMVREPALTSR